MSALPSAASSHSELFSGCTTCAPNTWHWHVRVQFANMPQWYTTRFVETRTAALQTSPVASAELRWSATIKKFSFTRSYSPTIMPYRCTGEFSLHGQGLILPKLISRKHFCCSTTNSANFFSSLGFHPQWGPCEPFRLDMHTSTASCWHFSLWIISSLTSMHDRAFQLLGHRTCSSFEIGIVLDASSHHWYTIVQGCGNTKGHRCTEWPGKLRENAADCVVLSMWDNRDSCDFREFGLAWNMGEHVANMTLKNYKLSKSFKMVNFVVIWI